MAGIGHKREFVSFERKQRVTRADYGVDTTVTALPGVWAEVKPIRGQESEEAGRQKGSTFYLVTVDSLTDVSPDDTLVWNTAGDLRMNVKEVRRPMPNAINMDLLCEAGAIV